MFGGSAARADVQRALNAACDTALHGEAGQRVFPIVNVCIDTAFQDPKEPVRHIEFQSLMAHPIWVRSRRIKSKCAHAF